MTVPRSGAPNLPRPLGVRTMRLSPVINLQESEAFDMASERIQGHIDRLLKEVAEVVSTPVPASSALASVSTIP